MIAERSLGQPNRFAYLQQIPYELPTTFHGVVKYDIRTCSYDEYHYGPGIYGSETPFCPRSGAGPGAAEDDGYLVSFVTDTSDWSSACLVFDAQNLSSGPLAKVKLPLRLPAGFHTTWVAGETLAHGR